MALVNRSVPLGKKLAQVPCRTMATEKQILLRINATSNIAKITKSMKMVSAAKMRGAENRLNNGRPFAVWLENIQAKARSIEKEGYIPKEEVDGHKHIVVPVTSDRGLCGGCNSFISKATRGQTAIMGDDASLIIVGDKGRGQLRRTHGAAIKANVTECWVNPPSFASASAIAEIILANADAKDKIHLIFNKFVSAIAYQQTIRSINVSEDSELLASYELEPDNREEVLADLKEFQLASSLFHAMIEGSTSEESSRMSAMENATSNAEELISTLTLVYNKARQARITTELIEIISGAASLDG